MALMGFGSGSGGGGGGSVTDVTASTPLASSGGATPNISLTGIVPNANTTGTAVNTASTLVLRDANGNFISNNAIDSQTSTASANGTTTLTVASTKVQILTGTLPQTFQLPAANTLTIGTEYYFVNNSTNITGLTVKNNGSTTITNIPPLSAAFVRVTDVSTANGVWDQRFLIPGSNLVPVQAGGFAKDMRVQVVANGAANITVGSGLVKMILGGGSISGITASVADSFWYISNATSASIIQIKHQDSSASAVDRIITPNGGTMNIPAGGVVWGFYDSSVSRNRVLGDFIIGVTSPLLVTAGTLSIPQGTSSASGYIAPTDFMIFNGKVGMVGGTGTANSVPYFGSSGLSGPPLLDAANGMKWNPDKLSLGIGVDFSDISASLDVKSDTAQTVATPSPIVAVLTEFPQPVAQTFTVAQSTPSLGYLTDIGTVPSNIGSGGYAVNDVVDYIITPYYNNFGDISVGTVSLSITGLTSAVDSFDISGAVSISTSLLIPEGLTVSRQVNGGGYTDFKRSSGLTFTDTNSGWTAGDDPDIANKVDDFVANGTDYTGVLYAYEIATAPDASIIVSPTPYDPAFIDNGDLRPYKMHITTGVTSTFRFAWPGTRNYDIALDVFTPLNSGPIGPTASGAPVTTPNNFGILSDGVNLNISYDYYKTETINGILVYSATPATTTSTDPNDGKYYYNDISSVSVDGKILRTDFAGVTAREVTASDTFIDAGPADFPDGTVVSPSSAYPAVINAQAHGTVTGGESAVIFKSLEASDEQFKVQFKDHNNDDTGSIKVTPTHFGFNAENDLSFSVGNDASFDADNDMTFNAAGSLDFTGTGAVNLDSTGTGTMLYNGTPRIDWTSGGGTFYSGASVPILTWAAALTLITNDLRLTTVGTGISLKEGSNAKMGTATLSSGTVTVSTNKVTANTRIFLTVNGGTLTNVGTPYVSARTGGTSFVITSTNILDASDVAWLLIEPN